MCMMDRNVTNAFQAHTLLLVRFFDLALPPNSCCLISNIFSALKSLPSHLTKTSGFGDAACCP